MANCTRCYLEHDVTHRQSITHTLIWGKNVPLLQVYYEMFVVPFPFLLKINAFLELKNPFLRKY